MGSTRKARRAGSADEITPSKAIVITTATITKGSEAVAAIPTLKRLKTIFTPQHAPFKFGNRCPQTNNRKLLDFSISRR